MIKAIIRAVRVALRHLIMTSLTKQFTAPQILYVTKLATVIAQVIGVPNTRSRKCLVGDIKGAPGTSASADIFRNDCIHCIFYHFTALKWYGELKSFLVENKDPFIWHCQHHGDTWVQFSGSAGNDLVIPVYSNFSARL